MALGVQLEAQNGVQVALGGQSEGQVESKWRSESGCVALGGQFEEPSGVQAALGVRLGALRGQLEGLIGVQEALLLHLQVLKSGTPVRLGTTKEGMI